MCSVATFIVAFWSSVAPLMISIFVFALNIKTKRIPFLDFLQITRYSCPSCTRYCFALLRMAHSSCFFFFFFFSAWVYLHVWCSQKLYHIHPFCLLPLLFATSHLTFASNMGVPKILKDASRKFGMDVPRILGYLERGCQFLGVLISSWHWSTGFKFYMQNWPGWRDSKLLLIYISRNEIRIII